MAPRKDDRFFVKLDAGYFDHPKTLAAGRDGWTLDLVAWTWCRQQMTDGLIPAAVLPLLAFKAGLLFDDAQRAADRLIEVKRWERTADGWAIHDYAEHQFTVAELEEMRAKARERQARWRATRESRVTDALVTHPESESESESESQSVSLGGSSPARARTREDRPTDDDTAKADQVLALVGTAEAKRLAARNPKRYARSVASDPERIADVRELITLHPHRDADWLAREHLGQPHPPAPKPQCGNCRSTAHPTEECPIP